MGKKGKVAGHEMPTVVDPELKKKVSNEVNALMAELMQLSKLGDVNDTAVEKAEEIRGKIAALLSTVVTVDAPCGQNGYSVPRRYDYADGDAVSVMKVGESNKEGKPFGKRVFPGIAPPQQGGRYKYSKKMDCSPDRFGTDAFKRKQAGTLGGNGFKNNGGEDNSIFSPRNANIRNGLMAMETKGNRFLPTETTNTQVVSSSPRVPASLPHVSSSPRVQPEYQTGKIIPPVRLNQIKVREVRTHDGYIMETAPRRLPTDYQRKDYHFLKGMKEPLPKQQ